MRRAVVIAAAVLVVLASATAFAVLGDLTTSSDAQGPAVAPPIDLPRLEDPDEVWRLADQRGTPVLVNFWASWCTPCRAEMPELQALVERSDGQIRAVGINLWDDAAAAKAFAEEVGVDYPLVLDRDGEVAQAYGITVVPSMVVIDDAGRVVGRASGKPTAAELERLVTDALGAGWQTADSP
ncbi:MAG: TlpA family protein disulfide reductase [Acidimicrobiales bacterium]|nr:TlpA family protein disulfide reductase [Acidimicrobiales bacterium]